MKERLLMQVLLQCIWLAIFIAFGFISSLEEVAMFWIGSFIGFIAVHYLTRGN